MLNEILDNFSTVAVTWKDEITERASWLFWGLASLGQFTSSRLGYSKVSGVQHQGSSKRFKCDVYKALTMFIVDSARSLILIKKYCICWPGLLAKAGKL